MKEGFWGNYETGNWFQIDEHERWLRRENNAERRLVGFPVTTGLLSPCWMVVYSAQDRPPAERDLHVGEVRIFKKLSPHWYFLHCR